MAEQYPVARLDDVTHRFGATVALDRVSFASRPGEVVALLGPNGAGKTTLVRILLGLIEPTQGKATLWNEAPTSMRARRRVGAMLQVGRVPETLTVREHVHLFSSYYGTPVPLDETLATAGVAAFADRRFGELSGGQRQRALYALAICGVPDLLVLDEPTVGLDVDARRAFWSGVRTLIARGCSVLLTTHYLEEADAVASRIVIVNKGRIVADGTPRAIKQTVATRKVRFVTSALDEMTLRSIYGMRSVVRDGEVFVALTADAERVARELLYRDPNLSGLEIASAGLEEAFLALTGGTDVAALSA
jgi:ABC-2 type transport system ATP-binding protein